MISQVIDESKLGPLSRIGQGGQGIVFKAPNGRTKFTTSIVYKQYKAATLAQIDFSALATMPALVEDSLSFDDAERLISITAWPCAMVEASGTPTGFVMPAIPQRFFLPITTVKGVEQTPAEFQHLLNAREFVAARGIDLSDHQRYALLHEIASALTFLHHHGICVGDISPKNLLFSLIPVPAVYFVDCDTMRVNGISVLPQVETPGWEVPRGEELGTAYSDTYKLGVLALRLLAGDQDSKSADLIPPTTPYSLRRIITDTLYKEPDRRPLPPAWTYILDEVLEESEPQGPPAAPMLAAPAHPVKTSRPTLQSRPLAKAPPPHVNTPIASNPAPYRSSPVAPQPLGPTRWNDPLREAGQRLRSFFNAKSRAPVTASWGTFEVVTESIAPHRHGYTPGPVRESSVATSLDIHSR